MGILQVLIYSFFFFLKVYANVYEGTACPNSYCGRIFLKYPFKLQSLTPPNDHCTYVNLGCNDSNTGKTPVVSLPFGGEFYVRIIDYYRPYIELYDPGDCLMKRLMNFNLSSSPFQALEYQNHTFYACPSDKYPIASHLLPIDCLSNDTIITSMTSSESILPIPSNSSCEIIGSWLLPVLEQNQFEYQGVDSDLYLKWDSFTCKDCQQDDLDQGDKQGDKGGSDDGLWSSFSGTSYFIPSFVALATFFVMFFVQIVRMMVIRNGTTSDSHAADVQLESTTATAGSTAGGLDDSKINSCTELVVISDSRIDVAGPDCNNCSICLENYVPQDSVRSIAKCEHLFHAECIELWLRKNSTCPVCRTVLAVVEL